MFLLLIALSPPFDDADVIAAIFFFCHDATLMPPFLSLSGHYFDARCHALFTLPSDARPYADFRFFRRSSSCYAFFMMPLFAAAVFATLMLPHDTMLLMPLPPFITLRC